MSELYLTIPVQMDKNFTFKNKEVQVVEFNLSGEDDVLKELYDKELEFYKKNK